MLIETLLCAYSTASSVLVAISGGSIIYAFKILRGTAKLCAACRAAFVRACRACRLCGARLRENGRNFRYDQKHYEEGRACGAL